MDSDDKQKRNKTIRTDGKGGKPLLLDKKALREMQENIRRTERQTARPNISALVGDDKKTTKTPSAEHDSQKMKTVEETGAPDSVAAQTAQPNKISNSENKTTAHSSKENPDDGNLFKQAAQSKAPAQDSEKKSTGGKQDDSEDEIVLGEMQKNVFQNSGGSTGSPKNKKPITQTKDQNPSKQVESSGFEQGISVGDGSIKTKSADQENIENDDFIAAKTKEEASKHSKNIPTGTEIDHQKTLQESHNGENKPQNHLLARKDIPGDRSLDPRFADLSSVRGSTADSRKETSQITEDSKKSEARNENGLEETQNSPNRANGHKKDDYFGISGKHSLSSENKHVTFNDGNTSERIISPESYQRSSLLGMTNDGRTSRSSSSEESEKAKKEETIKDIVKKERSSKNKNQFLASGLLPTSVDPSKKILPLIDDQVDLESLPKDTFCNDEEALNPECEIIKMRRDGLVELEGMVWKRRFFCSCLWHQRHFTLLKDGTLRYYRDKNSPAKSTINMIALRDIRRLDELTKSHSYRIILKQLDGEDILAFDEEDARNQWASKMFDIKRRSH